MGIDPNIILQAKQVQLDNPMDVANKAMNMRQLMLQNQQLERTTSEQNAMSDILKKNTVTGPDGTPRVNNQAALSDMYKVNPMKAMEMKKTMDADDLDALQKRISLSKTLAWSMTPDNYGEVRQKAIQMGVPHAEKLPEMYDPNVVRSLQMSTLSGEEQLKNQMHLQDQGTKREEFDLKRDDNHLKRKELEDNAHEKYVTHIEDTAKGWRSDPATTRADAMIGAAASGKTMIDRYRGREDEMPIQDIHALVADRLKAISGATPTEKEIEAQMPHTASTSWGDTKSYFTGKPQPANAGDFVKNIDAGFQEMEKAARGIVLNRQKSVVNSPRLSQEERDRISSVGVPQPVYQDNTPKDGDKKTWGDKTYVVQGGHWVQQ